MTSSAPAAMPSAREISGIIIDGMDDLRVDIHFDIDNKEQVADWAAAKIAALFSPILAEKERIAEDRFKWYTEAQDQKHRALAAEAALSAEREALTASAERARAARIFEEQPVDIRIEVDRGFFVITRSGGVIESHHTSDANGLLELVTSRIATLRPRGA